MPKLREITTIINQSLQAGNFHGRKFQDGKWYEIAYTISRGEGEEETRFPAIIDNSGEGTDVSFDDTYPIQFYHRIAAPLQYPDQSVNNDDSFGDGKQNKEIAEMVLICMGDRSKVGAYNEEICAAICADFPKELTSTQLAALVLQSCTIENIDTNTNGEEVFSQEFQNVDYPFAPENFMLAIRYRITTVYGKDCFNLCN